MVIFLIIHWWIIALFRHLPINELLVNRWYRDVPVCSGVRVWVSGCAGVRVGVRVCHWGEYVWESVCVCASVSVCVCLWYCVYIYMCGKVCSVCVRMYGCVWVWVYNYANICVYECVYIVVWVVCMSVCMCIYKWLYVCCMLMGVWV